MNAYALLERAVVLLIVAACAWQVFGHLLPQWRLALLRRLGRHERPPPASCASGCASCSGCASRSVATPAFSHAQQPIRLEHLRQR